MGLAPGRIDEETLLEEIERMPAQQAAAIRVLYVADDPTSNAGELAQAVCVDPILTAQVMRLANSAFYGLCGRVRSADFAVTVLGFTTVRSLAAAYAAGALGDGADVPRDFWDHAGAAAAGCAQIAPRMGIGRPEAFSLGLLHDLGAALLCQIDPVGFRAIEDAVNMPDSRQAVLHERKHFGMDHTTVAATVLSSWRFPDEMIEAIATHHDTPPMDASPLQRCLAGGHALAIMAGFGDFERFEANQLLPRLEPFLRAGDIDPSSAFDLSRVVRTEALGIAASFKSSAAPPTD